MRNFRSGCRTAAALAFMVCLAGHCAAQEGPGQQPRNPTKTEDVYVILTNIPEKDAWSEAVSEFKKLLHPEAQIVRFELKNWAALEQTMKTLGPRYVAVVVKPETLDINFQGRFLKLCTEIDDDPFCDFSFGFITGGTADEAVGFVRNISKAGKKGLPHKILEVPKSVAALRTEHTGAEQGFGVDWPLVRLVFGKEQEKAEDITSWMNRNLADFSGNGVIMMGGHGTPKGIVGNLSAKDIRKLNLFPAVVYNYACMTGCVSRTFGWLEEEDVKKGGDALWKTHGKTVVPSDSFALSVIAAGASAYVASLEPRLAGPGMTGELAYALAEGASLGDVRRREYDMLILSYLGWGEKGLLVTPFVEGEAKYDSSKEQKIASRDVLMMDGVSTVLFGDPSVRICGKNDPFLTARLTKAEGGFVLECATDPKMAPGMYCYLFDQYRQCMGGEETRSFNFRISTAVDLPEGAGTVNKVDVVEVTGAGGKKAEGRNLAWGIEKAGGRNRLQFKLNLPQEVLTGGGSIRVKFLVRTDSK